VTLGKMMNHAKVGRGLELRGIGYRVIDEANRTVFAQGLIASAKAEDITVPL
jgi:hypothetical protein